MYNVQCQNLSGANALLFYCPRVLFSKVVNEGSQEGCNVIPHLAHKRSRANNPERILPSILKSSIEPCVANILVSQATRVTRTDNHAIR